MKSLFVHQFIPLAYIPLLSVCILKTFLENLQNFLMAQFLIAA